MQKINSFHLEVTLASMPTMLVKFLFQKRSPGISSDSLMKHTSKYKNTTPRYIHIEARIMCNFSENSLVDIYVKMLSEVLNTVFTQRLKTFSFLFEHLYTYPYPFDSFISIFNFQLVLSTNFIFAKMVCNEQITKNDTSFKTEKIKW